MGRCAKTDATGKFVHTPVVFFKNNADEIESYRTGGIYKKYYAPCDVKEEIEDD